MINFHPGSNDELKPRISVIGVGGAGGNAVNNMIQLHLEGVEFIVANTDAQAMSQSRTDRRIQLGMDTTKGLGAGARPEIGRLAAEESLEEVMAELAGSNMVFITAGMGGGTGTGAAPVIARAARESGILTVGVITKPFTFEGQHRMRLAEQGIDELSQYVDTLIIIPNQNLFRVASERTTFADAFKMADDVLYAGVRGVTDLMIKPGMINLDFADIRTVMGEMGKAVMGTGEADGDKRALDAAEAAINNPLLEDLSMKGARGVLINITGGLDMTLFEADEAANRIREEVDPEANIIFGSTFDESMSGRIRVSVVATGIDAAEQTQPKPTLINLVDQKAAAPRAPAQPFQPKAPPASSYFNGSAAMAQPVASEPAKPAIARSVEPTHDHAKAEPVLQVRENPAVARDSYTHQDPSLNMRESAHSQLRMDPSASAQAAPQSSPYADRHADAGSEMRRPAGLFNRMAGHFKTTPTSGYQHGAASAQRSEPAASSAHAQSPQAQSPQAAPAAQAHSAAPAPAQAQTAAAPSASTRISPNDRLQTSRAADEDLLDIPAFLRRQAN